MFQTMYNTFFHLYGFGAKKLDSRIPKKMVRNAALYPAPKYRQKLTIIHAMKKANIMVRSVCILYLLKICLNLVNLVVVTRAEARVFRGVRVTLFAMIIKPTFFRSAFPMP